MRKSKDPERKKKHRKRFRVIMEIAFMVLGILCSIMPYPFPLLVPIGIGTIRIINSAVQREKKAEEPPFIVYCNGEQEPKHTKSEKASKTAKVQHSAGAIAEAPTQEQRKRRKQL